jgi:tetratricopeptide (TPR) repeat protein
LISQFDEHARTAATAHSPDSGVRKRLISVIGGVVLVLASEAVAQVASDPAASQAMQQGAEAMAAGNFSAAVAAYSTVTRNSPAFAEGYLNLGLAQFQAGDLDHAKPALERAQQLRPTLRGANLFLGIIAYRQNRFKDAEGLLERETRLDPHSAKAYMWLGVCRLAENDAQGAIAPLDKAFALDPKDADILYHRGHAYFLVANASYEAMFKLDHDSVRVHQVLGEAYAQAYRSSDAINEFEAAIKLAPKQPGLHEELADQYWIAGQMEKVADEYREELAVDPDAATTMYKLGSLLVMNQNATEGVQLLQRALDADSSLSDAHYYLGDGLMALGRDQDAVHEFDEAIAADPANDRAMSSYYKLAQVYRQLHEQEQAQSAMQNFLRMREESKQRQSDRAAQMVRRRSELPVADPERAAMAGGAG